MENNCLMWRPVDGPQSKIVIGFWVIYRHSVAIFLPCFWVGIVNGLTVLAVR